VIYRDDVTKCDRCWNYHRAHPELERGCAKVARDKGLTTTEVLAAYLRDFHRNGHR
jgi:hypothetical protein